MIKTSLRKISNKKGSEVMHKNTDFIVQSVHGHENGYN